MASNLTTLSIISSLLFLTLATNAAGTSKRKYGENQLKLLKDYEKFEAHVTGTITSIIKNLEQEDTCPVDGKDGNGVCPKPAPVSLEDFEQDFDSLLDRLENINTVLLALLPVVTTALVPQESKANVLDPMVSSKLNESVELSCDSGGEPLRLCFWEHVLGGHSLVVDVDDKVIQNDGKTVVHEFAEGNCVLKIQAIGVNDTGPWTCTLISQNGEKFTGVVNLGTNSDTFYMRFERKVIGDISHSNFQFSTALQENLPTNGNLVFSPFSLGLILLTARYGARGRTATQIDAVLKLPYPIKEKYDLTPIRLGFFKILKKIKKPAREYNLTIATRLYADDGFKIDKKFRIISKKSLDISLPQVNFADGVKAAESINYWINNETNGKVTDIIPPDSIISDTKLVMVNAIYFKSPWKYPFRAENTERFPFLMEDGKHTEVDMMVSEDVPFPSGDVQELNAKIVVLPYKGNRFSMQIMIPNEGHSLDGILLRLKATSMEAIRKNIRKPGNCDTVKLYFPKFKIESTLDLVEPLKKMGAADMFSEIEADFSGIPRNETEAPKLFVSVVTQKAYITVDEEGTEATAAPGNRAGVACSRRAKEIKADRPFYFQIVEDETNAVVFSGVVRDPNA